MARKPFKKKPILPKVKMYENMLSHRSWDKIKILYILWWEFDTDTKSKFAPKRINTTLQECRNDKTKNHIAIPANHMI